MKKLLLTLTSLTTLVMLGNGMATSIYQNTSINNELTTTKYSNFYVIGDSLSDMGAFAGAGTDLVKDNILLPPNSISLATPFYQNHYTNGDTAVKVLANHIYILI